MVEVAAKTGLKAKNLRRKNRAKNFKKAYLIDLYQEMIDEGTALFLLETEGGYMEIDTNQDFVAAKEDWSP